MCEMSLPHIGDFHTREEAQKWIVDNPACRNKGDDLDYRILPVKGYYPEYTTMPLLYYTDRAKWEEHQKTKRPRV